MITDFDNDGDLDFILVNGDGAFQSPVMVDTYEDSMLGIAAPYSKVVKPIGGHNSTRQSIGFSTSCLGFDPNSCPLNCSSLERSLTRIHRVAEAYVREFPSFFPVFNVLFLSALLRR